MVHGLSVTIGLVQGDFHHVSCTWTIGYVPGLFSWTIDDVWVRGLSGGVRGPPRDV